MNKNEERRQKEDYKIIMAELGASPFRMMKSAFALMSIIPLLTIFYLLIGRNFLYDILMGNNGFIIGVAIFISIGGFLFAYNMVNDMVRKLLLYSSERKHSDEEKTEVLLSVSHDLKTPLSAIKMGMQSMLDGIGGAINNTQTQLVQSCLNSVNKATSFINELMNISKLGFIRLNVKRDFVDFNEIIINEANGVLELAKKNNQNIKRKVLTQDTNMWADKQKISRAVMNLLSNAVKYTPAGGKIEVCLSGDCDALNLSVVNTGPGIKPDELEKIFDKFKRLKTSADIEGTGLGLFIVKEIVDLHKGHLTVRSQPGEKTEFTVVLPRDLRGKGRQTR